MDDLTFKIFPNNGRVSAQNFNKSVNDAVYLLGQFDAGISKRPRGTLNWELTDLKHNGAFLMNFTPRIRTNLVKKREIPRDIAPRVANEFISGLGDIETRNITPPYLSENGLARVEEMASLTEEGGEVAKFSFTSHNKTVEITHQTTVNLRQLLPIKRIAHGSIEGRLEAISIHKKFKALLYHSITNKVITCLFDESQIDSVKEALGKRVMVAGSLQKNINGDTVRIENPVLEILEGRKRFSLPSFDSKTFKSIPDFAKTNSTAEYMRRIRGK